MINLSEVLETNKMILEENLDVRTITMGISLLDCADTSLKTTCDNIYAKLTRLAKDLVKTGDDIGREFGVPVVNKRISITPIALVGASCCRKPSDFVRIAKTLDRAAKRLGVNFIGGYSAIVSKGMTPADELLIRSLPEALASTERICASVNVGSTKTGIDMDAVRLMGEIIQQAAKHTEERDSIGCAKLPSTFPLAEQPISLSLSALFLSLTSGSPPAAGSSSGHRHCTLDRLTSPTVLHLRRSEFGRRIGDRNKPNRRDFAKLAKRTVYLETVSLNL